MTTDLLPKLRGLTQAGVVKRRAGELTAAMTAVRACHELLDGLDEGDVLAFGAELVPLRGEWALTSTLYGAEEQALRGWERHWEQADRFGLEHDRRQAAAATALIHAQNGDRRYATLWLGRAADATRPANASASIPLAALAEAVLALDELDLPLAAERLAIAQPLAASERWADLAFVEARLAALDGKEVSGMARLRATCLAHYPKQWASGANWNLVDSATRILDQVEKRGTRDGRGGSSVTEYADFVIALRALTGGDPETAASIAHDVLTQLTPSLRTTAGMRLVLAVTAEEETDAAELADTAVEIIRGEHLYYLLPLFTSEAVRVRAAQHEELAPHLWALDGTDAGHPALTRREREVLWYIARGYRFEQIAAAEFISVNTVKSHAKKLYHRIGVNDRASAARYGEINPAEALAPRADHY